MFDSGIDEIIRKRALVDGNYAIAYALLQVAEQMKRLGSGDAPTRAERIS
jgi:hypothetical protein